ncbi:MULTISPECIES: hypothetical protein [unclassified Streptomyces]|nr:MULTISPECIES: hypothetical protein [unclassified Streptomyces]WSA90422.1 hypothetical protein OIE63_01895 [Streptomyces sp. NBC_01795]WSB74649.1 hypothetical protein OHB04_01895 [Streptomyces sp. NBC_01775]WSS16968.1 hypothetical protein OG533_37515 [Streptomyces sp. NBC_01186]WSS45711.1 hypothetical protein OG220_37760 [Streptomyces sp. NBC_01187]
MLIFATVDGAGSAWAAVLAPAAVAVAVAVTIKRRLLITFASGGLKRFS